MCTRRPMTFEVPVMLNPGEFLSVINNSQFSTDGFLDLHLQAIVDCGAKDGQRDGATQTEKYLETSKDQDSEGRAGAAITPVQSKQTKPERSTEPIKLPIPSKSPGYVGHLQTSDKGFHSRNIVRSLEQDLREEKSRNVVKKPHQSHYFTKILEDVDIIRGSTPPFIKNKAQFRDSLTCQEESGRNGGRRASL